MAIQRAELQAERAAVETAAESALAEAAETAAKAAEAAEAAVSEANAEAKAAKRKAKKDVAAARLEADKVGVGLFFRRKKPDRSKEAPAESDEESDNENPDVDPIEEPEQLGDERTMQLRAKTRRVREGLKSLEVQTTQESMLLERQRHDKEMLMLKAELDGVEAEHTKLKAYNYDAHNYHKKEVVQLTTELERVQAELTSSWAVIEEAKKEANVREQQWRKWTTEREEQRDEETAKLKAELQFMQTDLTFLKIGHKEAQLMHSSEVHDDEVTRLRAELEQLRVELERSVASSKERPREISAMQLDEAARRTMGIVFLQQAAQEATAKLEVLQLEHIALHLPNVQITLLTVYARATTKH